MKVLFATSEIAPWVKTGGLGDVSGALPQALHDVGIEVRVLVPGYPALLAAFGQRTPLARITHPAGDFPPATVAEAITAAGLGLLIVDCPPLYERPGGPYQSPTGEDWPDNALRFGLLSKLAALLSSNASPLDWRPDVLHCNDWQSGLAPAYLYYRLPARVATVTTIHNLSYQGVFPPAVLAPLDLPASALNIEGVEYYGSVSFLKAGLRLSDRITTVSPNYAREIQTPEFGHGLDGLLRSRADRLTGILNGIDETWNPSTDAFLATRYDLGTIADKMQSKAALRRRLGLADDAGAPLLGVVSRLAHQKGLDLLLRIGDHLAARGAQLALLGSGERWLQEAFAALAERHPGRFAVTLGYDESLAHQIEAGADIFLMPSRFEPCGLNQMYSLRYGTPPVVRATGGLADTVTDCSEETLAAGTANGFVFQAPTPDALLAAIDRAIVAWRDPGVWSRLQSAGMAADFSWSRAARQYSDLYRSMTGIG
jgi:starch synthase